MATIEATRPAPLRSQAPSRAGAPARAQAARTQETSNPVREEQPPAPVRDSHGPEEGPDVQLEQVRKVGQNFRNGVSPERKNNQERVAQATEPRPADSPEAAQVRDDYRQAHEQAEAYWKEGQQLAAAGPGVRGLPDGGRQEVRTLPQGSTEVVTTNPDGSTRSLKYDETGRVYVQNRGADGTLTDSFYRSGAYIATNPYPDFEEASKPSQVFNILPSGGVLESSQTGLTDFTTRVASPEGKVEQSPPQERRPPADPGNLPGLRTSLPYTGEGVKIGAMDDYDAFRGKMGPHCTQVGEIAAGEEHGVAPGADFIPFSRVPAGDLKPDRRSLPVAKDDPAALDQALRDTPIESLDTITGRMNEILADPKRDPQMKAFNMSIGGSRSAYYGQLENTLNEKDEQGNFRYPKLRESVYGTGELSVEEQRKRLTGYVDKRIDEPQSAYQKQLRDWQDVTRRFEDAGISVVVCATNSPPNTDWDLARRGANINDLARSPHVICVGAARPGGVWERSSGGEGPGGVNPTLVAPGVDVQTVGSTVGSGTSFATPYVCGVIALMLEANPGLTPAQIRQTLSSTADPLAGVDPRLQGAGVVDPQQAVEAGRMLP